MQRQRQRGRPEYKLPANWMTVHAPKVLPVRSWKPVDGDGNAGQCAAPGLEGAGPGATTSSRASLHGAIGLASLRGVTNPSRFDL